MTRKKSIRSGRCGYCGTPLNRRNGTREHVIPKCLFPPDRRDNLVIVPLCRDCNDKKATTDDYFRDVVISELGTDPAHVPAEVMGAFLRSDTRRQSRVGRSVRATGARGHAFTPAGAYRGEGIAYEVEPEKLMAASDWIARGLYVDHYHDLLPSPYGVHAGLLDAESFIERVAFLGTYGVAPRVMAGGLARLYYTAHRSHDGGVRTLTLLLLYNHVPVQIYTDSDMTLRYRDETPLRARPEVVRRMREVGNGQIERRTNEPPSRHTAI